MLGAFAAVRSWAWGNPIPGTLSTGSYRPLFRGPHQPHDFTVNCHRSHFGHILFCVIRYLSSVLLALCCRSHVPCLCPSPLPPTVYTADMSTRPQLHAFLTLDPSRVTRHLPRLLSVSLVNALDLPCIFAQPGYQSSSATLVVPSVNVFCRSCLYFVVGHGLPADAVFGNDWAVPRQPVLLTHPYSNLNRDRWMASHHHIVDTPSQVQPCSSHSLHILIIRLAPVGSSQRLWGPDVGALDALSSFLTECRVNDMLCFILFDEHTIGLVGDSCGER